MILMKNHYTKSRSNLCVISGSGVWLAKFDDSHQVPYIAYSSMTQYSPAYRSFVTFWTYIILFQVGVVLSFRHL